MYNQNNNYNQQNSHMPQNYYEQQRVAREMEKYNNKLMAKMHGLHQVPRVTHKMVEEALAFNMSQNLNVQPSVFTFARVTVETSENVWKHACGHTGVTLLQVYNFMLYTTPIYFTCCTSCGKITYHYEKQEQAYI